MYEFARFKTKYWLNVTTLSAPISVHECLVWGDKLWWFARELWLTCVWSEIMESKITHLENCATAKRHNCWHCRFSFWFCLRFEVKCAFVVSRGLLVDVQRGLLWKIDVWKEIVFLVNFGRWDLSCSSEGGIHTYAIHSWVKGTYLLWYIWIQGAPIQTFIWNRVYRSSNRLHVWEIQPLLATQQLKYKRRLHLVI